MRASHMSIDEFYKTPEWHRLSAKQKFFIQSYLASGNNDQVFATNCVARVSGGAQNQPLMGA